MYPMLSAPRDGLCAATTGGHLIPRKKQRGKKRKVFHTARLSSSLTRTDAHVVRGVEGAGEGGDDSDVAVRKIVL